MDNSKKQIIHITIRIGFGVLVALIFILPILLLGINETLNLYRIHFGNPYYTDRLYCFGIAFLLYGLVALLIVGYAVRRYKSLWMLFIPFILTMFLGLIIPEISPSDAGSFKMGLALEFPVCGALNIWMEKHGTLPANQTELQMAVKEYEPKDNDISASPYARCGKRIPCEFVYISNASGPYIMEPVTGRPGVVYCSFNKELNNFWLTATVLKKDVGDKTGYLKKWGKTEIQIISNKQKESQFKPSDEWVESVSFSPDNHWLIFAKGNLIKIWDVDQEQNPPKLFKELSVPLRTVAFCPGKQLLVSASPFALKLWEIPAGNQVRTIPATNCNYKTVVFSPDGHLLATGTGDKTQAVMTWDVDTGQKVRTFLEHSQNVIAVQFSPDGNVLAADNGNNINIYEVKTGKKLQTLIGHSCGVSDLAFNPDGKWIASSSDDGTVKIWDVITGRELRSLKGHNAYVSHIAVSSDGRWLASAGGGNTITMWNIDGWSEQTLCGHSDSVLDLAFNSNSSLLASGGFDHSVIIWKLSQTNTWQQAHKIF